MAQFVPLIVYFGAQQLFKEGGPLAELLPKQIASWAPVALALVAFILSNKYQQAEAEKAAGKLAGQPAPAFSFSLGDKKTTIAEFMKEKPLPTIIDFYQNFWPACGPAAQEIDKLAAADKYKGKVNFLLINMGSQSDADKFKADKGLTGAALHGVGQPAGEYGIRFIPHKVLLDKEGLIVKNGLRGSLAAELDAVLAG